MITTDPARVRKGRLILALSALFLFILPAVYGEWQQHQAEKAYFNNLHLKLSGVVHYMEQPNGYNGFGILGLRLLSSNITYYDKTDDPPYYCLIKGDSAEIYCSLGNISLGDTVLINTDNMQFVILKKDGSKIEYPPYWKDENRFYKRFVKRHQRIKRQQP